MAESESWYIQKREDGQCEIVSRSPAAQISSDAATEPNQQWGPFASEGEAIARRVGLIRAGKCQPM